MLAFNTSCDTLDVYMQPEMFEQHPIPQNVSSYQFKLVGDMTLKQFFQVAGGVVISLIIYSTSLPAIFKWPLAIASFLLGIALAFFPFQDRPLEKWIVLFFKSIYSPTQFRWDNTAKKVDYFQPEENIPGVSQQTVQPQIQQVAIKPAPLPTTMSQQNTPVNKPITPPTQTQIQSTPAITQTTPVVEKPTLQTPVQPIMPTPQSVQHVDSTAESLQKMITPEPKPVSSTLDTLIPQEIEVPVPIQENIPITKHDKESYDAMSSLEQRERAFLSTLSDHFKFADTAQTSSVTTPIINSILVDKMPEIKEERKKTDEVTSEELAAVTSVVQPFGETTLDTNLQRFPDSTPPVPPTRANIIVGQVLDKTGKIVESAILEIRDQDGRPARAIRTNQLGHFSIVTPLMEGNYQINTEKEGQVFDPVSFEVKNEIIPPIIIQGK